MAADFTVNNQGTIYLLTPISDAAKTWVEEHLPQDALTLGDSIVVEHRYIGDILEGIITDGLSIRTYSDTQLPPLR